MFLTWRGRAVFCATTRAFVQNGARAGLFHEWRKEGIGQGYTFGTGDRLVDHDRARWRTGQNDGLVGLCVVLPAKRGPSRGSLLSQCVYLPSGQRVSSKL